PKECSLCNHPEREEINAALLAKASVRHVSRRFGVSKSAVDRHKRGCLPKIQERGRELRARVLYRSIAAWVSRPPSLNGSHHQDSMRAAFNNKTGRDLTVTYGLTGGETQREHIVWQVLGLGSVGECSSDGVFADA